MGRRAGLPVVYLPQGSSVYWCRFTVGGIRYRRSTGARDGREAEAAAQADYASATLGRSQVQRRSYTAPISTPLDLLFGQFIVWMRASNKSHDYVRMMESHYRAHWDSRWKRVEDLTTQTIEHYKFERGRAVSSVTVHKELVTISRFLRWATKKQHIAGVPLFERVQVVSDYEPPNLSREDALEILDELPSRRAHRRGYPVRERFTFQWAQASRPGDVDKLRWEDVDLAAGTMLIRQSRDKARQRRVIPLAKKALEVLQGMLTRTTLPTSLIFGRHDYRGSIAATMKRVNKARKRKRLPPLPHITPHHFRHFRLSELGSKTRDVAGLQFIAGHKHLATTDRYVRSRTERARAIFEAIG